MLMFMMNLRELELRHLVALDAVAVEGTFGRAADRLGYTQSAVSQQIAALERIIGDKVFDRPGGPRPVVLTPLGEQVLESGRDLLARVDAMSLDLDLFRTGTVGRLSVGTFQSVSSTLLPRVVGRMREYHPSLELQMLETDQDDDLFRGLSSGELELAFVVGDMSDEFDHVHLIDDPFVLVARPGQFPDGSTVAVGELVGEPMIGQHPNSCQLLNEAGLRAIGFEPNYVFRTNDNGTVAAMVRAGMGVAIMPLLCVEPEDPRTALHVFEPQIPSRAISLAWRRNRTLSPSAERFIQLAVEAAHEMNGRAVAVT
jgi:DNA-binding transcriptional LysR family regulator